jgi:hypothetical protein
MIFLAHKRCKFLYIVDAFGGHFKLACLCKTCEITATISDKEMVDFAKDTNGLYIIVAF